MPFYRDVSRPFVTALLWFLPALLTSTCLQAATLDVEFGVLRQVSTVTNAVPGYLRPADNDGLAGALLSIDNSNGTGKFLGHHYSLKEFSLGSGDAEKSNALQATADSWYRAGIRLFLADLDTPTLSALREKLPADALVINYGNQDDALRRSLCLPRTLHTATSYSMRTDALAQWLRLRKLSKVMLVAGGSPPDLAYLTATKGSLDKFGHKLVAEKKWDFNTDLRRTAAREMPLFTQATDYDVVWVADESKLFGQYLPYNTWLPRPVIGTQGLRAEGWHLTIEAWGAVQLQNRFRKKFGREMSDKDYAAWVAIRSINESVTVLNDNDIEQIYPFVLSDKFQLAAYKGRKLTYRRWNGQLRQTVPLFHEQALVTSAPFEGFLHPRNELDTLGTDQAASQCRLESELKE